jgi:hypothetical protein
VNDDGQLGFDDLDDEAHARRADPFTSHEAAASIEPDKLRDSQLAVLKLLTWLGPMHHAEMIEQYRRYRDQLGFAPQSDSGLRSRCNELCDAGLVQASGELVVLPSGRRSIVWAVTPDE